MAEFITAVKFPVIFMGLEEESILQSVKLTLNHLTGVNCLLTQMTKETIVPSYVTMILQRFVALTYVDYPHATHYHIHVSLIVSLLPYYLKM